MGVAAQFLPLEEAASGAKQAAAEPLREPSMATADTLMASADIHVFAQPECDNPANLKLSLDDLQAMLECSERSSRGSKRSEHVTCPDERARGPEVCWSEAEILATMQSVL